MLNHDDTTCVNGHDHIFTQKVTRKVRYVVRTGSISTRKADRTSPIGWPQEEID